MSAIRKEAVFVDGQESKILCQPPEQDGEEGWSVTQRPYRPRSTDSLLENLGSDACCCVLAGNRVLMADGSLLPVEQLRAGDVVATMTGPARVRALKTTKLGMSRRAIELRGTGDECLFMTDDHPLWVSRRDKAGAVSEWWGTYNLNHLLYEMRAGEGAEFARMPAPLHIDLPEQVAHRSGWLHVRPIYHLLPADTPVYHVVVEEGFSFFAEGFALFSQCAAAQGPACAWQGLNEHSTQSRILDRVFA